MIAEDHPDDEIVANGTTEQDVHDSPEPQTEKSEKVGEGHRISFSMKCKTSFKTYDGCMKSMYSEVHEVL